MDSLRIPKGSGSGGKTPGSSVPMAIRFNASEESVEEVLKPSGAESDSLSNSPQHSSEDFSWRKDFLQASFFHRKRSGSVEGNTSPGSSLINNLSSGDTNTVGTWKLIKGKVSQAMEDIKSSKSGSQSNRVEGNDDSDVETATINSSMSDELSLDLAVSVQTISKSTSHPNDSDSDIDDDILDIEASSAICKSLANFRSKTTTAAVKPVGTNKTQSFAKKEDSPLRSTFLRKRKKNKDQSVDSAVTAIAIKPKKDVEIESGIEMLEDMILPLIHSSSKTGQGIALNNDDNLVDKMISNTNNSSNASQSSLIDDKSTSNTNCIIQKDSLQKSKAAAGLKELAAQAHTPSLRYVLGQFFTIVYKSRSVVITLVLFSALLLPLPEFFRGVIACLFTISTFSSVVELVGILIERSNTLQGGGPQKSPYQIPNYSAMPVCEIPAAEEHKSLKSYSGWMNEINNYDPSNYHISMTRPIFVRLDGSILRISNTTTRVPKRSMWNEQAIDKKSVKFTRNRCFNLLGCRIEMCPRGLARKRHFSRKYPIQLIVKTSETIKLDDEINKDKRHSTPTTDKETGIGLAVTSKISATLASGTAAIDPYPPSFPNNFETGIEHQNSNDSSEDRSEIQSDLDFAAAILNSDLQKLQGSQEIAKETVPCGDETRLLLFARCDREKEDWYRRFGAASIGAINDQELHIPDIVMMTDDEIAAAIKAVPSVENGEDTVVAEETSKQKRGNKSGDDNLFEGLLMTTDASRNPHEYVKFMSRYQKACRTQTSIPVIKNSHQIKRNRRQKKQEDELWKGIDQSLYLGPSDNVLWANVLIGRVLFSCLNDRILLEKIQEFLQKKLSAVKLPSFMEDVVIAQTHLGDTPPLIHRVSQPLLDERGTWIDADVTYEGLMHMTITTKLNLLRLKRQQQHQAHENEPGNSNCSTYLPTGNLITESTSASATSSAAINCAIYDSNAESTGASSSESESTTMANVDPSIESSVNSTQPTFYNTPGSSRRILRIVDRITASNLFQSATEISYIQRAMENMSTKITLRVELKGLVGRAVINFPPPPSDRIWLAFRGPPRLWISAKPAVGEHTFDWSIVTNVIESKLCEEVYKYLVYPNMVDIIAPFLGQSTYKE